MRAGRLLRIWWLAPLALGQSPHSPAVYLHFNGIDQYVEIPSSPDFSVSSNGLTVSAWMMPDTLSFPKSEGSGYVHWMGKGSSGQQEWTFRMYNRTNTENPPRPNRISFYVFNPEGKLGVGSYFEDAVKPGVWMEVTGAADRERTYIYRDGERRRCDQYRGVAGEGCHGHPEVIDPQAGDAPVRLGTRDLRSYFKGGLAEVRIWNRALSEGEVRRLYEGGDVPRRALVAEYLMNEGQGRVAHDSARGHDAAIVGAEWVGSPKSPR